VAAPKHNEGVPGSERRAEPIPGKLERAREGAAADSEVSFDGAALVARAVLPTPTAAASLVLGPGEPAGLRSDVPRHHGHFIVVSDEEVVLVDGVRRYRCARPGYVRPGGPPLLDRIVSVFVHRRAIGPLDKGHRFEYAIGADDRLLGTVDASDTWPLRQDQLEAMCAIAGDRQGVGLAHHRRLHRRGLVRRGDQRLLPDTGRDRPPAGHRGDGRRIRRAHLVGTRPTSHVAFPSTPGPEGAQDPPRSPPSPGLVTAGALCCRRSPVVVTRSPHLSGVPTHATIRSAAPDRR
jgi:hypothetical protein